MTRDEVNNTVNLKVKDNSAKEILPAHVREAMAAILDYAEQLNPGTTGQAIKRISPFVLSEDGSYTNDEDGWSICEVMMRSSNADTVTLSTVEGEADLFPATTMTPGEWESFLVGVKPGFTIFFSGITGDTTVLIFKKNLSL